MSRGGLWVCSSTWCEKGTMGRLCKNTLRVFEEIKERASVHSFWLTKSLGVLLTNLNNTDMNCKALSVYHMTTNR